MAEVRVCVDVAELASRVADAAAAILTEAVRMTGRGSIVLSGGSTPRALYTRWASGFGDRMPWADVHVFWGDERFVPSHDLRSNYGMAKETLLDHVPCPSAHVHPMPTSSATIEAAADEYEGTLRRYFKNDRSRFDLVLLGLGAEGHTASLFPGSPALDETTRWVVPVTVPADPPSRLTLTLPALNAAAQTYFLVTGQEKAPALARVLAGTADVPSCPALRITSEAGPVWWVDRSAAALYERGR